MSRLSICTHIHNIAHITFHIWHHEHDFKHKIKIELSGCKCTFHDCAEIAMHIENDTQCKVLHIRGKEQMATKGHHLLSMKFNNCTGEKNIFEYKENCDSKRTLFILW